MGLGPTFIEGSALGQGGKPQKGNPSGVLPGVILPRMAPLILGLLGSAGEYSYKIVTDFYRFFGLSWIHFLVIVEVVFTVDYLYHMHVFFSGIVLWRNYLINRVELFEEKSILVFPERPEAC